MTEKKGIYGWSIIKGNGNQGAVLFNVERKKDAIEILYFLSSKNICMVNDIFYIEKSSFPIRYISKREKVKK